MRADAWIKTL
jgi:aubergine